MYQFSKEDIDSIIKALNLKQDPNLTSLNIPSTAEKNVPQSPEIIKEFEEEIKQEKLDLNIAKEWVFELSLNPYIIEGSSLTYQKDLTELKVLLFMDIIEERKYYNRKEHYNEYFYFIKDDDKSMNLAKAIVDEKIEERKDKLYNIIDKYEKRYFLISMLRGEFEKLGNANEFLLKFIEDFDLSSNYVSDPDDKELKLLSESLGIDKKLLHAMYVAAHSSQMKEKSREIYEELLKAGTGLRKHNPGLEGNKHEYSFPVSQLLKKNWI